MHKLMTTKEAKIIVEASKDMVLYDDEDVYVKIYEEREKFGLPENIDFQFVLWVVANEKMKETRCEGCEYVADSCLAHQHSHLNFCFKCGYNPKPVLPVRYREADIKIYNC